MEESEKLFKIKSIKDAILDEVVKNKLTLAYEKLLLNRGMDVDFESKIDRLLETARLVSYCSGCKPFYNVHNMKQLLEIVKVLNPKNVIIFFDWDNTIVCKHSDKIIEPRDTKDLFAYLQKNKIYFAFVTARFHDHIHDPNINHDLIVDSVVKTMYPHMNKLGIYIKHVSKHPGSDTVKYLHHHGEITGLMCMGVLFGMEKGKIIKSYMETFSINKKIVIFIDDQLRFIKNVNAHMPNALLLKRL